jgi:hypothetical protein
LDGIKVLPTTTQGDGLPPIVEREIENIVNRNAPIESGICRPSQNQLTTRSDDPGVDVRTQASIADTAPRQNQGLVGTIV